MDMAGIHMVDDTMVKVEQVKREHEGVVLAKHRTEDEVERHR
jgi:hypothetical protein